MRLKISSTVATTSKQRSSGSSPPEPAPRASLAISLRTSRTSSWTLSRPMPLPPSRRFDPPPMLTGPDEFDVPMPKGQVENSARISSHRMKAASRES